MSARPLIGAVIIGRNEGDRLKACLASLPDSIDHVVYVDSGSTDGSPDHARATGAHVVDLDMAQPFTAARARNAGAAYLTGQHPVDLLQFIDGDCALQDGWIDHAAAFLQETPQAAVTCGRRRERFPDATIYNRFCDLEWDTPIGKAKACGGDALMRVTAFQQVGGFNPDLIAGEEPELCLRLRAKGWEIWRLDHDMTWHDAAITQFGQWWSRTKRAGFAYAEGAAMHGALPDRHRVQDTRRAMIWGILLPMGILLAAVFVSPWLLLAGLAYPLQVSRLALQRGGTRLVWMQALFLTLGKFAEGSGVLRFYKTRLQLLKCMRNL